MDKVLFYDIFGMPHTPKKLFAGLSDAEIYASEHDLTVGQKLMSKLVYQDEFSDLRFETEDDFVEANRITLLVTEYGCTRPIKRTVQWDSGTKDLCITYRNKKYFLYEFK